LFSDLNLIVERPSRKLRRGGMSHRPAARSTPRRGLQDRSREWMLPDRRRQEAAERLGKRCRRRTGCNEERRAIEKEHLIATINHAHIVQLVNPYFGRFQEL